MGEASWSVFGTAQCPRCGVEARITDLVRGAHECDPWRKAAHEAHQLAEQAELLEFEIEEYLRTPAGRAHVAFARWCRERGR